MRLTSRSISGWIPARTAESPAEADRTEQERNIAVNRGGKLSRDFEASLFLDPGCVVASFFKLGQGTLARAPRSGRPPSSLPGAFRVAWRDRATAHQAPRHRLPWAWWAKLSGGSFSRPIATSCSLAEMVVSSCAIRWANSATWRNPAGSRRAAALKSSETCSCTTWAFRCKSRSFFCGRRPGSSQEHGLLVAGREAHGEAIAECGRGHFSRLVQKNFSKLGEDDFRTSGVERRQPLLHGRDLPVGLEHLLQRDPRPWPAGT